METSESPADIPTPRPAPPHREPLFAQPARPLQAVLTELAAVVRERQDIDAREKALRAELLGQLEPLNATGTFIVNGLSISMVRRRPTPLWAPGWAEWVARNHQDEVQTTVTTTVRPAFQNRIVGILEAGGDLPAELADAAGFLNYTEPPAPYLRIAEA